MLKSNASHQHIASAKDIWTMETTERLTEDFESHYRGLLNFLDVLYYRNGNSSYQQVCTRHTVFYLAMVMPSLAILDKHRTREISYNLHIASEILEHPLLTNVRYEYDAKPIRMIEIAFTLAIYRIVSGKKINDERYHKYAKQIYMKIMENGQSAQGVYAIETIQGTYQVLPNIWAMMILKIHDKLFDTNYSHVNGKIVEFIKSNLVDKESGLYREYYKTGAFGIPGEFISKKAAWHSTEIKPSVNSLAIAFMHYLDKEGSRKAWAEFKKRYTHLLLSLNHQDIRDGIGKSYLSQLAPTTETLYGALLVAKELDDIEFFDTIQKHIMLISGPDQREGKIFFDHLGESQVLHGHFIFFARAHAGWGKIFSHPWKDYYQMDYIR